MRIFALSDIHLSFKKPVKPGEWEDVLEYKPMDIFGEEWREHYRKIYNNWQSIVKPCDVVLMPGDFSWALKLGEAINDLNFLGLLPGLIIGISGNHDFWWESISKVRAVLPSNVRMLQNDHLMLDKIAICGSRGWICPNSCNFSEKDFKIYQRELIRLENSLKSIGTNTKEKIAMMHFMPTNEKHERSGFIDLLLKYEVSTVVYGHLHAKARNYRLPDKAWGINFYLVSADYLNFTPRRIR